MLIVHSILRFVLRMLNSMGLALNTALGQRVYIAAYEVFKLLTEGREINIVSNFIKKDSLVIDVGANIGVHTKVFLSYIGEKGKVIAVEPELKNAEILQSRFSKELKSGHLVLIEKAVTNMSGDYFLHIDSCNPGGHKIASDGIPVKGITIDQIVQQANMPPSLIKIDVEGYEESVLLGAKETIMNYRPVIFMEVHPELLSYYGTDYVNLLENLENHGYKFFLFEGKGKIFNVSIEQIGRESKARGWKDILVVPTNIYA